MSGLNYEQWPDAAAKLIRCPKCLSDDLTIESMDGVKYRMFEAWCRHCSYTKRAPIKLKGVETNDDAINTLTRKWHVELDLVLRGWADSFGVDINKVNDITDLAAEFFKSDSVTSFYRCPSCRRIISAVEKELLISQEMRCRSCNGPRIADFILDQPFS